MSKEIKSIPVIDLFAGPGGLGEGFSALGKDARTQHFKISLSIEKEKNAFNTLRLRSFFRKFSYGNVPEEYYNLRFDHRRNNFLLDDLFNQKKFRPIIEEIDNEVRQIELGGKGAKEQDVDKYISDAVKGEHDWVLIGGPPCQAYSMVGRARNRGIKGYRPEKDHRHFLYKEYLRIISKHWPPVFIMENVKGILTSRVNGEKIFPKLLQDLVNPSKVVDANGDNYRYRVFSFTSEPAGHTRDGLPLYKSFEDFVIKCEDFGIPQARHRVILLGIREDINVFKPEILVRSPEKISVKEVIDGLPKVRSGLSREPDSPEKWKERVLDADENDNWLAELANMGENDELVGKINSALEQIKERVPDFDRGGETIPFINKFKGRSSYLRKWYQDNRMRTVFNHSTRGHIQYDLQRYLYASCFAKVGNLSPLIRDFPQKLLPNHKNVSRAMGIGNFSDRFRVQRENFPATTIMSHISKDGHYYIHYDPVQCRSLTVREAARLQTFPDNYIFTGPRTQQYVQVGNAVPPVLAVQLAKIVLVILKDRNG